MRVSLLAAAFGLALALAPLGLGPAAAEPVCAPLMIPASACVVDETTSDGGDCASGGFEGGTTKVDVEAPGTGSAEAGGSSFCSGSYEQNTVYAEAYTGVEGASASWTEFAYEDPENGEFRQCFISSGALFQTCPEGASPPNPGWGALLP